ncbi:hypothetical protein AN958_05793 [Leucoagaricus sp. SymC.cos]|nr:hypothetical protein AN958_05793 [Leucoagaricus sp. SymC.cos]
MMWKVGILVTESKLDGEGGNLEGPVTLCFKDLPFGVPDLLQAGVVKAGAPRLSVAHGS